MVLNVLASVSQWEREIIAGRVTTALAHLKALGRQVGGVPLASGPCCATASGAWSPTRPSKP